ncbi:General transcription factor II-I repeat domain-containing protein 2A [Eumeta japonica]|uniref:General transcription factor II-I repeat domain-containing protein 2A n=1 Tax=Eumeta variegata TaxID=151549 RepID=A0A4C1YFN8_EUMVA|nr:General transcription factor II-I repeat domain-containing protein 2A [Eumeta japonica]
MLSLFAKSTDRADRISESQQFEKSLVECELETRVDIVMPQSRRDHSTLDVFGLCLIKALDESTDLSDTTQLTIFIRGVDKEFTVTEEFLALQPLKATAKGEDIFNEIQKAKCNAKRNASRPTLFCEKENRLKAAE